MRRWQSHRSSLHSFSSLHSLALQPADQAGCISMFNINRLLRSRPQTDNADQAPAQDRPSRQPSPAQGLLSPLLARPRRRESRSAADTSTPRNAAQGRFSRSPLHPSSQPEALAGASSAPPRSIEHDIDDWLAQSLPMAERIPTGYNLHDGREIRRGMYCKAPQKQYAVQRPAAAPNFLSTASLPRGYLTRSAGSTRYRN